MNEAQKRQRQRDQDCIRLGDLSRQVGELRRKLGLEELQVAAENVMRVVRDEEDDDANFGSSFEIPFDILARALGQEAR